MPEIIKTKDPSSKKLIILITSLVILIVVIIVFLKVTNKDISLNVYNSFPEVSMEVGGVGSIDMENGFTAENQIELITEKNPTAIEDPVRPLDLPIPNDIFNTSGVISGIYGNYIVVRGIGTNFDDQVKRDLTVNIDENTSINGVKGGSFQTALSVGDEISIESAYNIHGKTEFTAKYINIIDK